MQQIFFRNHTKSSVKPKLKTFPVFNKSFQFQKKCRSHLSPFNFQSPSKLAHAEREYRLPLVANIEPLFKRHIDCAVGANIKRATRAYFHLSPKKVRLYIDYRHIDGFALIKFYKLFCRFHNSIRGQTSTNKLFPCSHQRIPEKIFSAPFRAVKP